MSNLKKMAFVVLALACLTNFVGIYSQYQLSPFAPQLMEILSITPVQFSSIFTASFIPGAFLSLFAGVMADRFGLKRTISFGLIIATVGSCFRIFAPNYISMMICMILIGLCGTLLNANSAKLIGSYFTREKSITMMSIYQSSATVAMIIAMATTNFFASIKGAFIVSTIISIVVTVLWLIFAKDPVKTGFVTEPVSNSPTVSIKKALIVVAKSKNIWIATGALTGVMASITGINVFLPTVLAGRGIDPIEAGMISSIMLVGNLLGCLGIPFIANRLGKNKPILIICSAIGALGAAFAWQTPEGFLLIAALFITGACLSGIIPLVVIIPVQLKEIGPLYAGTAGGFVTTLKILGTLLIPSYIIAPLTVGNMPLYYGLCGVCVAFTLLMCVFLPDFGRKAIEKQSVN